MTHTRFAGSVIVKHSRESMRRFATFAALVLLLPLQAACVLSDVLGLNEVDEPAVIIFSNDTSEIVVADTVTSGVSFEVRVVTFGGGCVGKTAQTKSAWSGNELVLRPFNTRYTGDDVCTADIRYLTHVIRATRNVPGPFILKVIGHQRPSPSFQNAPAELSRTVFVR